MTVAAPPQAPTGASRPEGPIRIGALPNLRPGNSAASGPTTPAPAFRLEGVSCWYGDFRAIRDVSLDIERRHITALIGPSGCGKSTLLRTMNRMNDLVPSFHLEGEILLDGQDLYDKHVDPVAVRRRVGMVFQKPNPFPKSIYDNVAFGPRLIGFKGDMDGLVEESLRRAAIWGEIGRASCRERVSVLV